MRKDIDLVVILKSGIEIIKEVQEIRNQLKTFNTDSRILYYFPCDLEEYNSEEQLKYYAFQNDQFYENEKFWMGNKSCSEEKFKNNSLLRLSAKPIPENGLILCDDWYYTGNTMKNCFNDFVEFGYNPKKIFGFSVKGDRVGFIDNNLFTEKISPSTNCQTSLDEIVHKINN